MLLGVPSLRLRADYLAIVTVAGAEIIRFLALNRIDLTGGAVGSIGMLGQGNLAQYNTAWEEMLTRFTALLTPLLGAAATRDMAMLLIVWTIALVVLVLMWIASARRGVVCCARFGRRGGRGGGGRTCSATSCRCWSGRFWAAGWTAPGWQISVFSPTDCEPTFTFYAYLI